MRERKTRKKENDMKKQELQVSHVASLQQIGSKWTPADIKKYCIDRLFEIEMINHLSHTPSAFVCIASFIAFLSELAYGTNKKGDKVGVKYRDFVLRYLPKYKGYENDLYETFRCGLVHSMSLYKQPRKGRKSKRNDALF